MEVPQFDSVESWCCQVLGGLELWGHRDLELEGFAGGLIRVVGGLALWPFGELVLSSAWGFRALGTWGSGALGGCWGAWEFGALVISGPGALGICWSPNQGSQRLGSLCLWGAGVFKCLGIWSSGCPVILGSEDLVEFGSRVPESPAM